MREDIKGGALHPCFEQVVLRDDARWGGMAKVGGGEQRAPGGSCWIPEGRQWGRLQKADLQCGRSVRQQDQWANVPAFKVVAICNEGPQLPLASSRWTPMKTEQMMEKSLKNLKKVLK